MKMEDTGIPGYPKMVNRLNRKDFDSDSSELLCPHAVEHAAVNAVHHLKFAAPALH